MPILLMLAVSFALMSAKRVDAQVKVGRTLIPVDFELVLAVDVSSSMDRTELQLQREGYAAALSDPAIATALTAGPFGRIALLYVEWGRQGEFRIIVDWTLVRSAEDAHAISDILRSAPIVRLLGTSISGIMETAGDWIDENDFVGTRRVIDISGDGPNSDGRPVLEVRAELAERGIEVNGLPLMVNAPVGYFNISELDQYFEDCVITGSMPFVVPVYDMASFEEALRRKLVMEIAGRAPTGGRLWRVAGTDCLIGEKLRWHLEDFPDTSR